MNNKNRNKNLDKKYKIFLDTIKLYPDQLKQAWDEVNRIEFPDEFKYIDKVVISAMGGSALGARIIDSLLINRIRVPVEIFNQYHIPNYADEKTLFIAYSYSGNTEETINSLNEAISKEIKTIVVSTGGKLEEIAKNHKLISYTINPYNNPSKQPRMGLGYAIGAIFAIFSKLSLVNIFDEEIESALVTMQKAISNFDEDVELHDNLAKKYADNLKNKAIIIISSEHLSGICHAFKNQLNENAKTFADLFEIPELNHHFMEGLGYPKKIKDTLLFIFFTSNLYTDKVQRRYPITWDVIKQNGFDYSVYSPFSNTKIDQVIEVLIFASFITYYISKSYHIDPETIPWVDYFKKELAKI